MPYSDLDGLHSALLLAVESRDTKRAQIILETEGCDDNARSRPYDISLLFWVMVFSSDAMIDCFLKHQKKSNQLNYKDYYRNNDLISSLATHATSSNTYWKRIIGFVQKYPACDDILKKDYGLALQYAVAGGQHEAAKALLNAGASMLEFRNNDSNNSLLHHAVSAGDERMVALLLQYGCNNKAMNTESLTPIQFVFKTWANPPQNIWNCILLLCKKHPATQDHLLKEQYGLALFQAVSAGKHENRKTIVASWGIHNLRREIFIAQSR